MGKIDWVRLEMEDLLDRLDHAIEERVWREAWELIDPDEQEAA